MPELRAFPGLTLPALLIGLAACGADAPAPGAATGDEKAAAPAVDPAVAATITGQVVFEGAPPDRRRIDMSDEPVCADKHPDGPLAEDVVVNENGTLRNVIVYVKEGLGDGGYAAPQQPVEVDQDGCVYRPRVVGLQVGQSLVLRNSDGILHNINAKPTVNRGFNISQPTSMTSTRSFAMAEVMIPLECDVHGWMRAFVGVFDHPYHAVTAGAGDFTIASLPPGEYVVEAWHERYGTQTATVTVGEAETQEIRFTFREAMAATAVVPMAEPIRLHPAGDAHHHPSHPGATR